MRRFPDLATLVDAAAAELAILVDEAVQARGACQIALSGGSTPRPLYQQLATMALPWDRVELWWGDERTVPANHVDSNYRMAREALLDAIGARVHRIAGEREPVAAAADYERDLVDRLGTPPVLDIALLGLGSDGHTASLFPDSPAVRETARWVAANPVAQLATTRITMTAQTLCAARHVRFLVAGVDKAPAVAAVLEGPRDPDRYPAQLIAGAADVVWFIEDAAAGQLAGAA
ncbi:MAG: 6-phosphogluconolactonase [Kofleriaceae bacterium]